jgi:hypothetical protein
MAQFALRAVRTVFLEENGRSEVDIKHFVKVEKVWQAEAVMTDAVTRWWLMRLILDMCCKYLCICLY